MAAELGRPSPQGEEMSIERETTSRDIQAPPGTYEFLEQIGDHLFVDAINHIDVWIAKETVCAETGGSCMDLSIRDRADMKRIQDRNAHITQDGTIVSLSTYSWDSYKSITGYDEKGPTPDIKDMLSTVKNLLSREDVKKLPLSR
jgi:hypothetical protein